MRRLLSIQVVLVVLAAALVGAVAYRAGSSSVAAQAQAPADRPGWLDFIRPATIVTYQGTIPIRLSVALHSRQLRSGDRFEAALASDLNADGKLVAPAGSPVKGRITEITESGKVKGRERMTLVLEAVQIRGKEHSVETEARTFIAKDDHQRDAAIVGGGTAVGALIGGIAGGGKGAAVGAITGAAAGTGVVLESRGRAVVLGAGARLDFVLVAPLRVKLKPGAAGTTGDGAARR